MNKLIRYFFLGIALMLCKSISAQQLDSLFVTSLSEAKKISAYELLNNKRSVIAIVDVGCVYVEKYANRLKQLSELAQSLDYQMIFLNPHVQVKPDQNDTNSILEQYNSYQWSGEIMTDPDQKFVEYFSVSKVPEILIVDGRSNKLEVLYKGAIDDNPQDASNASENYVENVVRGEAIINKAIPAMGCHIKRF